MESIFKKHLNYKRATFSKNELKCRHFPSNFVKTNLEKTLL